MHPTQPRVALGDHDRREEHADRRSRRILAPGPPIRRGADLWADSIMNTVYDGRVNGGIKIIADDSGLASDVVSDGQLKPRNG